MVLCFIVLYEHWFCPNQRFALVLYKVSLSVPFFFSNSTCSFCVSVFHFGNSHNVSYFVMVLLYNVLLLGGTFSNCLLDPIGWWYYWVFLHLWFSLVFPSLVRERCWSLQLELLISLFFLSILSFLLYMFLMSPVWCIQTSDYCLLGEFTLSSLYNLPLCPW